jgi:carbamoyl-phosphate synthase large subunit
MKLRNTVFQDNHFHSTYSDGKFTVQEIMEYNFFHDQLDLTISDHVNKETDWFPAYAEEIQKLRKQYPQFALRIGCEVKILEDGTLNTTKEILEVAEVVIGSVHHFTNIKSMNREELLEKEYELTLMLAEHSDIDILGHPFSMCKRLYNLDPPKEYVDKVHKLCVKNGIKFELNEKQSLSTIHNLVTEEIEKGNIGHFSFGSDMHENLEELGDATFALADPVTVLVTGAGAGIGQSILKSLKLSKVKTRIIAVDMDPLAAGLYRSDAAFIIPSAKDPKYISALKTICKTEQVDLVLIGTDVELDIFAQQKEAFEKETGAKVIVSSQETIKIADDKWKTTEFLQSHNFHFVRSALSDDVDAFLHEAEFPLIAKPRIGARSIGFHIVPDEETLRSLIQSTPDLIVQEYLNEDDEEYTCGSFFYEGECYGVISMKRWLRNGDTYKAVSVHDKELELFIEKVGSSLNIVGPCNFQLRKSNGEYKIFEINCRFSGTTGARSALGFNVVNALLQHIFFGRPLYRLQFHESHILRYWNEVFVPLDAVDTMAQGHLKQPESFRSLL